MPYQLERSSFTSELVTSKEFSSDERLATKTSSLKFVKHLYLVVTSLRSYWTYRYQRKFQTSAMTMNSKIKIKLICSKTILLIVTRIPLSFLMEDVHI